MFYLYSLFSLNRGITRQSFTPEHNTYYYSRANLIIFSHNTMKISKEFFLTS